MTRDPTPASRDNWTPEQRLVAGDWKPMQQLAVLCLCGLGIALVVIGFGIHWLFRAALG